MTFDRRPDLGNANVGKQRMIFQCGRLNNRAPVFLTAGGTEMVTVNGEKLDVAGQTVLEFLKKQGYAVERVVVERNREIVPRAQHEEVVLLDGDEIEIVRFVGGG